LNFKTLQKSNRRLKIVTFLKTIGDFPSKLPFSDGVLE